MKLQISQTIKTYKKSNLANDLMAGLMVAIIALPLSIALGLQSVPSEVSTHGIQFGIITAIVAGFFISAFGGSKYQIGGPTAAFVVILYGYLANPDIGVLGLAIAGILAGILLILMSVLRVGDLMKFFPYPITIGFTTGIGVTLFIGQIKDFCGFTASGTEAIEKLISYAENISTFDFATFSVGVLGLLCVILLPKISKKIPAAFVALLVCTGATALLNSFANTEIATIGSKYGEVQAGFFPISFEGISSVKFPALIVPSIVIAFLCAIESLLSATVASGMTKTDFDANQELFGQGVANICSSLLGGLPATGAIARTAASIENGAKTCLAGVFHAIFVLIMYFALMDVVKFVPLTVFSAILISVAINMSHFPLFMKLTKFGIRDVIILLVTCILTIIFDLTYGVLGGLLVTFIANAKNLSTKLEIVDDITDETATVHINGSLFFLNANKFISTLNFVFESNQIVYVDCSQLTNIDETALEKISAFDKKLKANGKELNIINCNKKISTRIDKFFNVF